MQKNICNDIKIFALPFKERKDRKVIFKHRPDQSESIHTKELAALNTIEYIYWDGFSKLKECDIYLITGAGILSEEAVRGKKIVNAHGGIIPSVRGLDSLKWAIHYDRDIGVTLHYIDENVDAGEVIYIKETKIYSEDTLATLARRHYESEIELLSNFDKYINCNINYNYFENEASMRMPINLEEDLQEKFKNYKLSRGVIND